MLLISNGHIGPERRITSHNWLKDRLLDNVDTEHQAYVDIESFPTNERPVKLAVNCVQDLLPAEEKAGLGVWKADFANLTEKSIICWDNLCGKRRGILIERNSVSEFISLLSDHNFSQLKQNVTANWRSIQNFLSRSCRKKVWIFWLYKPKCLRRKVLSYLLYLKALISLCWRYLESE